MDAYAHSRKRHARTWGRLTAGNRARTGGPRRQATRALGAFLPSAMRETGAPATEAGGQAPRGAARANGATCRNPRPRRLRSQPGRNASPPDLLPRKSTAASACGDSEARDTLRQFGPYSGEALSPVLFGKLNIEPSRNGSQAFRIPYRGKRSERIMPLCVRLSKRELPACRGGSAASSAQGR